MAKFFHIENVNRQVGGVTFEIYDIVAGCPMGVFKAEDDTTIAALTSVTANPAFGVTEMSEQDYEKVRKKKAPGLRSSEHWKSPTVGATPMKGAGHAIVVEGSASRQVDKAPANDLTEEDVMQVATVPQRVDEKILAKPKK